MKYSLSFLRGSIMILLILVVSGSVAEVLGQCPTGDVRLENQSDITSFINQFPDCSELNAGLIIHRLNVNNPISDLSPLSKIKTVQGDLNIRMSSVAIADLSIDSVYGSFYLSGYIAGDPGISTLKYVGANFVVRSGGYNDFTGFEGLEQINGKLDIQYMNELVSFKGLHNIKSIAGDFLVSNMEVLENFNGLDALDSIGGQFGITNNKELLDFTGLDDLRIINGPFNVNNNDSLLNFDGLYSLEKTMELEVINNDALINCVGLSALDSVLSRIAFFKNDNLLTLEGLSNLSYADELRIHESNAFLYPLGLPNAGLYVRFINFLNNQSQLSLLGLEGLEDIGERLNVANCQRFNSVKGLSLPDAITGSFTLYNTSVADMEAFDNVRYVGGDFKIQHSDSLLTLPSMSLNTIEGDFILIDAENLQTTKGFQDLESINGNMTLGNLTILTSMDLFGNLQSIGGKFTLSNNDSLIDIEGIASARFLGNIVLGYNESLSTCAVESVCRKIINEPEFSEVYLNNSGCNNIDEILPLCSITNSEELDLTEQVVVYPNPVTNILYIRTDRPLTSIHLFDLKGNIVKDGNSEQQSIALEGLESGLYNLVVRIQDFTLTKRVIKY